MKNADGASPYSDLEYARELLSKSAALAEAGQFEQAIFYRTLAAEARLLAELTGRWECGS